MRTAKNNDVLTTGQVAKICHVSPRTVSKWFDSGKLRGYVIPGSKDRRIPLAQLTAFMHAHDIPLDALDGGTCRVVVLDDSFPTRLADRINESHRYSLQLAGSQFEAGSLIAQTKPHVFIAGNSDVDQIIRIFTEIRQADFGGSTALVAINTNITDQQHRSLLKAGADVCITQPVDLEKIIHAIEQATDIFT